MNILDELRWQARPAFDWLESIVRDVTPDQAAWRPPGNANTIAATYAHIVRNVDEDINQRLFRRPRLNETTWAGRTGLTPGMDDFDRAQPIDWLALRDYGRAVAAFVIEATDKLTEPDLELAADLSTPDIAAWHGLDIFRLTVGHHVRMHGGEIACLKGVQGLRGYTFGLDAEPPR